MDTKDVGSSNSPKQLMLQRWLRNDQNMLPVTLFDQPTCPSWSDQARQVFQGVSGGLVSPQELLQLFTECWHDFQAHPRGSSSPSALLQELRLGGQTGQTWLGDMMALTRCTGDQRTPALHLIADAVRLATGFTSVGSYTKEKVQLLSAVLAEMTNSILIDSAEPKQRRILSMDDQCRYPTGSSSIIVDAVHSALEEFSSQNEDAVFYSAEENTTEFYHDALATSAEVQVIREICINIYQACWKVLQGRVEDLREFHPQTIKKLIIYFEVSYFFAHRSILDPQIQDYLAVDPVSALIKVRREARPAFAELADFYASNQPTGLFSALSREWQADVLERLKLQEAQGGGSECLSDLMHNDGLFGSTEPKSWAELEEVFK